MNKTWKEFQVKQQGKEVHNKKTKHKEIDERIEIQHTEQLRLQKEIDEGIEIQRTEQ